MNIECVINHANHVKMGIDIIIVMNVIQIIYLLMTQQMENVF